MPVQWYKPVRREAPIPIVNCPPNRTIVILTKPEAHSVIALHWSDAAKGSIPCQGDSCRLCGVTQKRIVAYAPALVYGPRVERWVPSVFCIGDWKSGLATTDHEGIPIYVGREAENPKTGRTIYLGRNPGVKTDNIPLTVPFDVRPILLRRWGLFDEADLIGCERHEANPLFVEEEREII